MSLVLGRRVGRLSTFVKGLRGLLKHEDGTITVGVVGVSIVVVYIQHQYRWLVPCSLRGPSYDTRR